MKHTVYVCGNNRTNSEEMFKRTVTGSLNKGETKEEIELFYTLTSEVNEVHLITTL